MPPPSIHQVHIADGFADDCEELISQCLKKTDRLTYEIFCEIWKELHFGYLYHGRPSGTEMAELSEELLHIAKHYMVANTSNFEESVAGLFIVYGVINLQPYPGFAPLVIIPEDVPAIHKIELIARRQKRYDVLYILGFLLIEGPVEYHAEMRERGMESCIKKYLEGYTSIDRLGIRPKGVFYRQNEELDILRELSLISRRYSQAKESIQGENSRNLNFFNPHIPAELDMSLKKIINGIVENNKEADAVINNHYERVQAIKNRAMVLPVEDVKYLQSAGSANKSPVKKPSTSCEIKQSPGKIRQGNLRKVVSGPIKKGLNRKRCKFIETESSSSEETEYETSDEEEEIPNDIDLEKFDKSQADPIALNDIKIDVDSMPVYVSTEEDGQALEFKYIDNYGNIEDEVLKKLDRLREISVEPVHDKGKSGQKDQKPEGARVMKTDRRYQKRPILKSKLKRMGMLNVANFDDSKLEKK